MIKAFFFSQTGCFLPLLIILNLLFGWIFLKPAHWLLIEAILILFFLANSYIVTQKIFSGPRKYKHGKDVIDIEGEVIKDKDKLK